MLSLTEDDLKDLYKYVGETLTARFNEDTKGEDKPLSEIAEKEVRALRSLQKILSGVCYFDPGTFQLILEGDYGYDVEKLLIDPDQGNMLLHTNDEDIVAKTIVKWRFDRDK